MKGGGNVIKRIMLIVMMMLFTSICNAEVPTFFTKDGSTWIPTAKIYNEAESYILDRDLSIVGEIEAKVIHVLGKKREAFVDTFYVNFNKNAGYMASRKKVFWDKNNNLKKEETRSAGIRYNFNERVMGQIADAIKNHVRNTVVIFNIDWGYALSGPGFEQCKGIIINGKDINQAISDANKASHTEAINRIGADKMRFHKNQALRLDAGKPLYDDEYKEFNINKVIVHGIFKKNYYAAAAPYAEKLGLKLVINNNKFMDGETEFDPKRYLGLYIPNGNDYMHQRLYITENKEGEIDFTYYENAISNSGTKYPHIGNTISKQLFAEAVRNHMKKTIPMYHWGVKNGNASYYMEYQMGYDGESVTCSIKKVAPVINDEEWEIYQNNLELRKEKN